jgi:hypothetical protein
LRRKCWSVVNFIVACRHHILQVKSANLSSKRQVRARSEHNTKITIFMGKETLQNLLVRQFGESNQGIIELMNLMLAGFKLREPQN